jgi:DNA-binding NtrC family response regulator
MDGMTSYPNPSHYANHILVASPSSVVRQRVLESLRSLARRFKQASGGAQALVDLESGFWQVLFLDRDLPDLNAEELSDTVRQRYPGVEVVLLDPESDPRPRSAEDSENLLSKIWPAVSLGNINDTDPGSDSNQHMENGSAESEALAVAAQSILEAPLPGMIGNSKIMQSVYRLARLLAPRNTTVLITGPTGCGKEIVARAIHHLSPRAGRAFAVVNCAAIPETLLEAELFGYARGAFTGAMQSYAGRIHAAQGGTLFLDEIGEMPLSLQPKLLRFLEQKELQRLGSAEVVSVDARVVSATNAHLLALVRGGKFREDLYYRLCGFPIEIPPLRDRSEDIAQLAVHFLEKLAAGLPAPQLSDAALQLLQAHRWDGNIRELQNVMERGFILSEDQSENPSVIRPEHLLLADTSVRYAG